MSTLADATLIQSAMESHQAEWLREGQHPRAATAVFGRPEGQTTFVCCFLFGLVVGCCFFYMTGHDPSGLL